MKTCYPMSGSELRILFFKIFELLFKIKVFPWIVSLIACNMKNGKLPEHVINAMTP